MQPSSFLEGRTKAVSSACKSSSWPGLACIMTTRATASLGCFADLIGREDLRLIEVRDFFVLRFAMARDCTPVACGIGNRRSKSDQRNKTKSPTLAKTARAGPPEIQ